MMTLRDCFDRHGCDKGKRHGYERVYAPAFEAIRNEKFRLLEVGIFKGASIAAWIDYFPNATIVGMDVFSRVKPEDIPILNHPRVEWLKHDSMIPANVGQFDVIIDDGSHTHIAQSKTFEALWSHCDMMYFIEDVWPFDRMTEKEKERTWLQQDGFSDREYEILMSAVKPYDVEFHDLRVTNYPDSYIIGVT